MSSETSFFKEKKTVIIAAALIISAIAITSMGALYYFNYYGNVIQFNVFHAGSLTVPLDGSDTFEGIEDAFEAKHPGVDVVCQGAGSRTAIRWVTEAGKIADVVASADYTVIQTLMIDASPQWTTWYIIFASNSMSLMYGDTSKYVDEINETNWYEILQRNDVKFGVADPDQDPCGYRTRLVWKLADVYFNTDGEIYENLTSSSNLVQRPKEVDLLALLESGEIDYVWIYSSVAVQHDHDYMELPKSLDLSSPDYKDYYSQVNLTLSDETVKIGEPILYAVSIPNNSPHPDLAVEFIELILSTEGRTIFTNAGQSPVEPGLTNNVDYVPDPLQSYVVQWGGGTDSCTII
ncbi:MAG: tungstate ABC transporter substrate-binding protein WtpA [Candidatus Hermodarchaeota archaeon]